MMNLIYTTAYLALTALATSTTPGASTATPTPTATTTAAASADTTPITIQYDTTYDNSSLSLNSVSCSDGPNGLETTKGYTTLGSIPDFPFVGGSPTVSGWDSPNCGACYAITYAATSTTIYVTAVDAATAGDSFVLSQQAMDKLTGGQAVALGHVDAVYAVADAGSCS